MRNLAAIRTLVSELNKLDPEECKFGWAHLHPDGLVVGMRCGMNGNTLETSRLIEWPILGELTIAGAHQVINSLHKQIQKTIDDRTEDT